MPDVNYDTESGIKYIHVSFYGTHVENFLIPFLFFCRGPDGSRGFNPSAQHTKHKGIKKSTK